MHASSLNIAVAVLAFSHYALAQTATNPLPCATTGTLALPQKVLTQVRTANVSVGGFPAGIVYAPKYGNIAFVATTPSSFENNSIVVLDTTSFPPTVKSKVLLPEAVTGELGVYGVSLTPNQEHLLVASGVGGYIVNTANAVSGNGSALAGVMNDSTQLPYSPGRGAFDVRSSSCGKYAFVAQEDGSNSQYDGNVDIFKLTYESKTVVSSSPVGYLNLSVAVASVNLSPNGKTLYATSEQAAPGVFHGLLSVLNVSKLETSPSTALEGSIPAGCGTVRSIVSHNGTIVWTTARYDNSLLAFDAAKIVSDPAHALLANITTGTSPVGLTFARNETRILTADSDRFKIPGAVTGISVIDVQAALAGKGQASNLGRIPTGLFPRDFGVSPDGSTVLVSDFSSGIVQAIDVASLP